MSADRRTVATDALETLGQIIDVSQKRDAIHLAVEPVVAAEDLEPGEKIMLTSAGAVAALANPSKALGIVDPFLERGPMKGERFWLVVFPRQIHSLRHVWTHPAFPDVPELDDVTKADATTTTRGGTRLHKADDWPPFAAWDRVRREAERLDVGFDDLVDRAMAYVRSQEDGGYGEYWTEGPKFEGEKISDGFWDAFEIVAGVIVPEERRGSFLSCSC